jgi:hypothetical protein
MVRFAPVRVASDAVPLPQRAELGVTAGKELVDVRLVAGVEQDPVDRGLKDPVQGDGELHHAEVRTEVAAVPRDDLD